jgi:hypothetical protein
MVLDAMRTTSPIVWWIEKVLSTKVTVRNLPLKPVSLTD